MSSLRKLAREVSELADRYDAVMALDEAAMVPRAALEWLAGISEGCAQVSPCPAAVLSYDKRKAACRECLVQAALKAAEEATQSE